jgi:hypothetical protein
MYLGTPSHWVSVTDTEADSLDALSKTEREELALVRGHVNYGIHERLGGTTQYITFLRHPVEHVRSQYEFYRRKCEGAAAWNKEIEEVLRDDSARLDNQQVRRVSGIGNTKRRCTREDYERAVQNLNAHFAATGLTGRFDESLVLMKRVIGWKRPLFYHSANVGAKRAPPTDTLRKEILEFNKWDYKLWSQVEDQFEEQAANEGLQSGVRALRRRNRVLSPLLRMWRGVRTLIGP